MQGFLSLINGGGGTMMLIGVMGAGIAALFYRLIKKDLQMTKQDFTAQNEKLSGEIAKLAQALCHVKELLTNHITDTNKKVDKLEDRMDKFEDKMGAMAVNIQNIEKALVKLAAQKDQ